MSTRTAAIGVPGCEFLLVVGHYTVDAVGVQVAGDLDTPKPTLGNWNRDH